MKLLNSKYLSDIELSNIHNRTQCEDVKLLCKMVRGVRHYKEECVIFEETSPTWVDVPKWSEPSLITEESLYDHIKRDTGLVKEDYTYRISIYKSYGEPIESPNVFFGDAQARRVGQKIVLRDRKNISLLECNKDTLDDSIFLLSFLVKQDSEILFTDELKNISFSPYFEGNLKSKEITYPCIYELRLNVDKNEGYYGYLLTANDSSPAACRLLCEKVFN